MTPRQQMRWTRAPAHELAAEAEVKRIAPFSQCIVAQSDDEILFAIACQPLLV